jgi:hypothetical protein
MIDRTPEEIIESMKLWFEGRSSPSVARRTDNQKGWDSAILAAAEYVRRRMNYDEDLSLEIHKLLSSSIGRKGGE